jgi:hypothetical protein
MGAVTKRVNVSTDTQRVTKSNPHQATKKLNAVPTLNVVFASLVILEVLVTASSNT